jgi:hypothetical protein
VLTSDLPKGNRLGINPHEEGEDVYIIHKKREESFIISVLTLQQFQSEE